VKVFFDNCTSPVFAGCLDALVRPYGHSARHVRFMDDMGFRHDTPDLAWIQGLAADGPDWIVVTGDQRIRKNMAERTAWIRAQLKGFALASAYQKTPVNQCASTILWRWPEMESFISLAAPGSMFEMSINRRTGFRPLAIQ
jgi:hypothetical protein